MFIETFLFGLLAAMTLAISLMVETSSWCVRVHAGAGSIGSFIARTNIYLYGGRFFAILTQVVIGFLIDQGSDFTVTCVIFVAGFLAASTTHAFLLGRAHHRTGLEHALLRLMRLDAGVQGTLPVTAKLDRRLFLATTGTAFFFGLALVTPLVLASVFPDYRLTLNNAGSLVNFLGMLLLLGYLDPLLYRALDQGKIAEKISSYIWGRSLGFLLCGVLIMSIIGLK